MKFYTDVHIAMEVVRQLRRKGIDMVHGSDVGMSDVPDATHLQYASEQGRVMVSCDEDFEILHWHYQQEGQQHAGIVYFQMGEKCKSIGNIVNVISFLVEAADYETDLFNQFYRA